MVQAWSIGGARKSTDQIQNAKHIPGPGAYTPNKSIVEKSPPKFAIGRSARNTLLADKSIPGPGTYEIPQKAVEGPKYHMGLRQSTDNIFKTRDIPGPGQYQPPSNAFSTIAFSIGSKGSGHLTSRDGPGPGEYKQKSIFEEIKGPAKFGKFVRIDPHKDNDPVTRSLKEIPGPGAYNGEFKNVTKSMPRPIFGTAQRDRNSFYDTQSKLVPGPGTYEQKGIIGKEGASVTISPGRPETSPSTLQHQIPGPGAYDQSKYYITLKNVGSCKIGRSRRRDLSTSMKDVPGPDQYSIVNSSLYLKREPQPVFGTSKRQPLLSDRQTPGPGQYQIPNRGIEGRLFSMASRYRQHKPDQTPGPDAYENKADQFKGKKAPAYGIGYGPKTERDLTSRRYVPGPGAYDYKDMRKSGVSFTIAKRYTDRGELMPGPGAYKVPVKFADVPKYLIPNQDETFKFV